MQTWEIRGERKGQDVDHFVEHVTVYADAPSEPHALEVARRLGLAAANARPIEPGHVPQGTLILPYPRPGEEPLALLAASPIVRAPALTIALGVTLGVLLSACVLAIIASWLGGVHFGR